MITNNNFKLFLFIYLHKLSYSRITILDYLVNNRHEPCNVLSNLFNNYIVYFNNIALYFSNIESMLLIRKIYVLSSPNILELVILLLYANL